MSKLKVHKLYCPIYRWNIIFGYGGTKDDINKKLESMGLKELSTIDPDSIAGKVYGRKIKRNGKVSDFIVIWILRPHKITDLAHEVFHLVEWILTDRGVVISKDSTNETWAYYSEYWMRTFMELIGIPKKYL